MVKTKYLIMGGFGVIVGVIAFFYFLPHEEKRVKNRFYLLSEWVSKTPEENAFTALQKMKDIGTLFDERCELKVPEQSLSGNYTREEISTYAGSARSYFTQIRLSFYDLDILFPEKGIAKVTLTARLTGRSTAGERVDEVRELDCDLKKIERKWLFRKVEVVEVLKR